MTHIKTHTAWRLRFILCSALLYAAKGQLPPPPIPWQGCLIHRCSVSLFKKEPSLSLSTHTHQPREKLWLRWRAAILSRSCWRSRAFSSTYRHWASVFANAIRGQMLTLVACVTQEDIVKDIMIISGEEETGAVWGIP